MELSEQLIDEAWNINLLVCRAIETIEKAAKSHNRAKYMAAREKVDELISKLQTDGPLYDQCEMWLKYLTFARQKKYDGGSTQTYESRYKAVSITGKWKDYPITENDFNQKIKEFLEKTTNRAKNGRFSSWIYCIEHISTNIHCHLACRFDRKKWASTDFYKDLREIFPVSHYDVSLKASDGTWHLTSKNAKKIHHFVRYIMKQEDDKIVYTSGFKNIDIDPLLFNIAFFKQYEKVCPKKDWDTYLNKKGLKN